MNISKIKGISLSLGGEDYIVPPLSLGALEQLQERILKFNGDIHDREQIATVIDAVHSSLRRNYPDITREAVADLIGLECMSDVFEAVMDVNGTKRRALEDAMQEVAAEDRPQAA